VSLRIVSTYTPLYPPAPSNGDSWTDPNTGITWFYSNTWSTEGPDDMFGWVAQNYGWNSLIVPDYWAI
jgi:hypothetical protein